MRSLSILEPEQNTGLVHLYVGDGKGKTTAAVGLAVRFLGGGGRVLFCQFLKGRPTGELEPLERLGAVILRAKTCGKFVSTMDEAECRELRESHEECLRKAAACAASGEYGLVVLDEAVNAVNCGAIPPDSLPALLNHRAPTTEIVLTGRNPSPGLVAAADYHTEFLCRRHPFGRGVAAREGVEY